MTPIENSKRWIMLVVVFGIAGIIGGGLIGLSAEWMFPDPRWGLRFLPFTGLLVVCFALPLWRVVVREDRTGRAWGAVIAATIPVYITLLYAAIMIGSSTQSFDETMYNAALFQVLQLPLTLILAFSGAVMESYDLSSERIS